jgi:hypothetical protein
MTKQEIPKNDPDDAVEIGPRISPIQEGEIEPMKTVDDRILDEAAKYLANSAAEYPPLIELLF